MDKPKRDIETNNQISITTIVIQVIIIITFLFLIVYLLFSKTQTNKKIKSINDQISTIIYENSELENSINELNNLITESEDTESYLQNLKEEYKDIILELEKYVKKSETNEKIAYLSFITTSNSNLDKVVDTLKNNNILATFYVQESEISDYVTAGGHLVGLYLDDEEKIETVFEDNKSLIETYDMDLFMVSDDLKEKEITIPNMKQVIENSTSEDKKQLDSDAYADGIVMTSADRDFLIIKINTSNSIAVNALQEIISGLKDKNYIFLPLISNSSVIE